VRVLVVRSLVGRSSVARSLVVAALALLAAACAPEPPLNVLIVTLDTTRADHLGPYGREGARTHSLDRLAAEGVVFENCFSAVPVTLPSHSTIMTGTYPLAHGVRDNGLFQLPEGAITLAEVLHDHGYRTGAAIGAFPLTSEFGIQQGFDFFDDHVTIATEDYRGEVDGGAAKLFFDERPAPRVNDAILPWLRQRSDKPFLAWIHYWDAHQPFLAPPPYDQLFADDLYRAEIAFVDESLGRILDELERQGVLEHTLVVVTGDHGEGRGEHDEETHSQLAYNATLHVPLIVRMPGLAGGHRVSRRVGTVDILPTVLDLLGLPIPEPVQGRSQAPLIRQRSDEPSRGLYYSETLSPRFSHGWGELRVLYEGDLKYIHGPRPELFDLATDPDELRDLTASRPQEAARMEQALAAFMARNAQQTSADAAQEVDPETRQRLIALGYVSAGGAAPDEVREELRSDGDPPQDHIRDISLSSQAKQALTRGDLLAARELSVQLVGRDPANPFFRSILAMAYLRLGQLAEAAQVAEQSPEISALNSEVFLDTAQALFRAGERARAMALARRCVGELRTAPGLYLLAEMLGAEGDDGQRETLLEQAIELDPSYARARRSLAIGWAASGRLEQARPHFVELLRLEPRNPRNQYNFAVALQASGRGAEAVRYFERAIELDPSYWAAHLALLTTLRQAGDREALQAAFERLEATCQEPEVLRRGRRVMEGA
jgi:arylsulfatase A-like enzyme/Tfp pilus assembly protein PilF